MGTLREMVSPAYADVRGQDERAIRALLAFHLLRNESIHLLTRVVSVEVPEPGRGEATAFVAMAGVPIPDAAALPGLRADLYRFAFTLAEEDPGTWRVVSADWRRAAEGDFL